MIVNPFFMAWIGSPLKYAVPKLKLGKILHGTETPLRAVYLLVEQAAEAHRVETEASLLLPVIRIQVELARRMAIDVAIETRHARLG